MEEEDVAAYYQSMAKDISQEMNLMYKLNGVTNIVNYQDHVIRQQKNGIGWEILIRMELLTSLTTYLMEKGELYRQDVIRLGIDLCKALERCQQHNTIHRDIKPDNIFLNEQLDYKLGDFGIAKFVETSISEMSKKGTNRYMAPEVYKGESYGYGVDIYSLGLVMYTLLNNRRMPFLPDRGQFDYIQEQKAHERRMRGEEIPLPCMDSTRLGEIVVKACSYNPKDRYSSPLAMRMELEALLDESKTYSDSLEKDVLVWKKESSKCGEDSSTDSITDLTISIFGDKPKPPVEPSKPPVEPSEPPVEPPEPPVEPPEPTEDDPPKNKKKFFIGVGILGALLLAIIGGIWFVKSRAKLPDIQGLSVMEATDRLEALGFQVGDVIEKSNDTVPKPLVIGVEQNGEFLTTGDAAKLNVPCTIVKSSGTEIIVENYIGKKGEETVQELRTLGIKVVTVTDYSEGIAEGMIMAQDIDPGAKLSEGDSMKITISLGPKGTD